MTLTTAAILLGLQLPGPAAADRTISGIVLLAPDRPTAGVLVRVLDGADSAVTDRGGRFTLARVPDGDVRLAVTGAGIRPDTVFVAADRDTVTIVVERAPVALDPVVITGTRLDARVRFEETVQPSITTLSPADIAATPGLLEADVLRTVQLLPGTVAKNDYSIGFNVRGGESDQNLILLDGLTVFNPSHLAGLFSTFDANAVDRADFFSGGFPAQYPSRLSSVLDVSLRTGDRTATRLSGQVSLLSTKLLLEGPAGGATYLLGARRTYADVVVSAFTSEVLPYYFTDLVGKLTVPGLGGVVTATGYWGRDVLDFRLVRGTATRDPVNLAFDWGNALFGVSWRRPVATGFVETRLGVSRFSTTLGLLPNLARFDNRVLLLTGSAQLALQPGAGHEIRAGVEASRYAMDYQVGSPSLETTFLDTEYRPAVFAAYLDDQWRVGPALLLRPGLRAEYVTGQNVALVSPRAAVKLFLSDRVALTASAGRYRQAIHSIRDQEIPITVYEFWIGADRFIPVARSDQMVLGAEAWLARELELKVEGYRKTFHNLVTPNRAQDLRVRGDEYIPASGDAWGVDVLLRRHVGAVRGWLAYGFVRTTREAEGITFPPAHDRRHTLNVVLQAPGPLGSDLGVRWGYGSPLPYTGFLGEWDHRRYNAAQHLFDDRDLEPIPGPRNAERYPAYSRLDVGFRWQFEKFGGLWQPYLQIANVYNRRNVFLYFFDYLDTPPTRTGVSQLPFLPTFGVEFVF